MRKIFIDFFFGLFLTIPRDTPGSDLETIWGAGIKSGSVTCKARALPTVL